jgi:hypothetical protein
LDQRVGRRVFADSDSDEHLSIPARELPARPARRAILIRLFDAARAAIP